MIRIPRFKNNYRVYAAPPDLIFFLSKSGYQVLRGRLTYLLAPLINGKNNIQQITRKLKEHVTDFDVQCGLLLLEDEGYITYTKNFWPSLPSLNIDQKIFTGAHIISFCKTPIKQSLNNLGITSSQKADFTIVLVDDYLSEELKEFNERALHENKSWMIAKPTGDVYWLGPVFRPPDSPCWECLARRLRENFQVESVIQKIRGVQRCIDQSQIPKSIRNTALKWIASKIRKDNHDSLQTLDLREMKSEKHAIARFDSCICKRSKIISIPIVDNKKTFERYQHHISPLTGIVHELHLLQVKGPAFFCAASHLFVPPKSKKDLLRKVFRQRSAGKGITLKQAKTGALCEALERYSGVFRAEDSNVKATFQQLGDKAIHPNSCMNFSAKQYKNREEWNQSHSDQDWIPVPFDEKEQVDWTAVWSLTNQKIRYIPAAYCYYGYQLPLEKKFCRADSNGNAAGNTIEEAILSGFMELVERDAIAIWWYNRLRRPGINLDSFALACIKAIRKYYQSLNRSMWVLDITSDFNIPTFAAISSNTKDEIIMGFGAHFNPTVALTHALTEMNQFLPPRNFENVQWRSTNLDFLKPDPKLPQKHFQKTESNNDVEACVKLAQARGMETFVLNQTRSDLGLPVVKVVVPGMRQFWPRFARGRLYDIPVQMGWLKKSLTENQLNPDRILI